MNRPLGRLLLLVVGLQSAFVSKSWAGPPGDEGLRFGTDESIISFAELPPEQQRELFQDTKLEPWAVGFAYRRAFVFHESFALWHWRGRFLLHCGDNVIEPSRADLERFVGPDLASQLRTPWIYRLPPGLLVILGGIVAIGFAIRSFPTKITQVERLLKDERYRQAADVYHSSLPPPEEETTVADRRRSLGLATEFLVEKSVPRAQAEANLRSVVSFQEEMRSRELRVQAVLHEQAGEWDEALDLYEEAAELREMWDAKDRDYLRKCIARVEQKQAPSKSKDE